MLLSRRDFLKLTALGAGLFHHPRAHGMGERSLFRVGQLHLAGPTPSNRQSSLEVLAFEIEKRTAIAVHLSAKQVQLSSPTLHETPFLYLSGQRAFPLPSTSDINALRRFLNFGGMLVIDSAEGAVGGAFDQSVRALVKALYPPPGRGLSLVPEDHVVYKSFYLLRRPAGRIAVSSAMEAVIRDERLVLAYIQNDLGGAWAKDESGNFAFECLPGGARQRELSFRLGINLVMYALCQDYKTDQVHVPFILRRRRWRSGP